MTELLRKYCYGENKVKFELVSDQKDNFSHTQSFPYVNFEEKNINVSLPVFSIHGNHDDPTGKNPVCQLEVLSASGLINYFGKIINTDDITVKPLLLKKNNIQVALFGLGSLAEERLHRSFQKKQVHFDKVEKDWFSILVVHQNRVPHGSKYLPEHLLTGIAQFVVWGHEHECIPEPSLNEECGFHVLQPGSSVATSLCPAEAQPKHVMILEIGKTPSGDLGYLVTPIQLKTVRPFYFKSLDLDEVARKSGDKLEPKYIEQVCVDHIEQMLSEAFSERSSDPKQPSLPLIRLRVDCTVPLPFGLYTFGHQFVKRVANPGELLRYRVKTKKHSRPEGDEIDTDNLDSLAGEASKINIEDVVTEIFQSDEKNRLSIVSERGLSLSVREMVEKEATDSIENYIESHMTKVKDHLLSLDDLSADDKDRMEQHIEHLRLKVEAAAKDSIAQAEGDAKGDPKKDDIEIMSDSDDDQETRKTSSTYQTKDRKRKASAIVDIASTDDDDDSGDEPRSTMSRRFQKVTRNN